MNDSAPVTIGAADPVGDPGAVADDLATLVAPEFRTVATAGGRKGIRLESVFWRSLSAISEALGQKRSTLVARVIERAGRQDLNAASALRSYVADELSREVERLRPLASLEHSVRLMQQAPIPSFALNRQKKLLQVNPEFMHYLRIVSGNPARMVAADVAQLSLDLPVDQLFSDLRPGIAIACRVTVRVDDRHRQANARIVAVPPWPLTALVGYILP